jgi:Na+/H+ antiporter NhaD/arsenite permease-like protein
MNSFIILIFVLAYGAIALEHLLRVNKSAFALICAGLLWSLYALVGGPIELVKDHLSLSLKDTAEIVFFLMGAMATVEIVDAHDGFDVITSRIKTSSLSSLVWIVGFTTFFLSAIMDNLTTTIVMISLMKKLLEKREDRQFFVGIIIIAANSGGAWTPIGDVTTTILWIGGKITSLEIMKGLFLPSLVNLMVPLAITSYRVGDRDFKAPLPIVQKTDKVNLLERNVIFFLGLIVLLGVPIFKTVTHLPPFMGILLGLGLMWIVSEILHREKPDDSKEPLTLVSALKRIDMSSILFFVGILLSVAVLDHVSLLSSLASWLDKTVGRLDFIIVLIGLASAVIDNVPLVVASMGMYDISRYPTDSFLWEFLAYCAGTGGSILIIGSAAGVAAMGLEKIDFLWYLKKISLLALAGYGAGAIVYILQYWFLR